MVEGGEGARVRLPRPIAQRVPSELGDPAAVGHDDIVADLKERIERVAWRSLRAPENRLDRKAELATATPAEAQASALAASAEVKVTREVAEHVATVRLGARAATSVQACCHLPVWLPRSSFGLWSGVPSEV